MTVDFFPIRESDSTPAGPLTFEMPPDKSILHRILIIGSLTKSAITIPITSPNAISHDVIATMLAMESLGVPVEMLADRIELQGVGMHGFRAPTHRINCANSGTTARLMMGLLAAQPFSSTLVGDGSLSRRPMKRLADLLVSGMNAQISTTDEGTLPAIITGSTLIAGNISLRVASAQMKSAILLAALYADGETRLWEPGQTRDHTERMLGAFGVDILRDEDEIVLVPPEKLDLPMECEFRVPGDLSSAAFMIAAAVLLKRQISITNVSLNPTRTRLLDVLTLMGIEVEATNVTTEWGEDRGTLVVFGDRVGELQPINIAASDVTMLIDELPILAVLMAFASGTSTVRGALELRRKESDRIAVLIAQFQRFGIICLEHEDGFDIEGSADRSIPSVPIEHDGDHRLAMAFAIAALRASLPITMTQAECVRVSYPDFFSHLTTLSGEERIQIGRNHADA